MAKSLRSKVKRKFRAIKRDKYQVRVVEALKKNGTEEDPVLKKPYAKGFLERKGAEASGMEMEGDAAAAAPEAVVPKVVDPGLEAWAKEVVENRKSARVVRRKMLHARSMKNSKRKRR
mmetsp:Transcript_28375/g.74525  ORF Transcript_28375/g.74525 Transcript_28375/m.74525 type:complete len:118 (+) Transcript_28375:266-619(+)